MAITPQIIVSAQQKGGVGKTTTLCTLAYSLAEDGAKILIFDADIQQNAYDWADKTAHKNIDYSKTCDEQILYNSINEAIKIGEYDVIMIDTQGIESQMLGFVILAADLILVPAQMSETDMKGLKNTFNLIERQVFSKNKPTGVVVVGNMVNKQSNITKHHIEELDRDGHKNVFGLPNLTGFKEMYTTGGVPKKVLPQVNQFVASLQNENVINYYKEHNNG